MGNPLSLCRSVLRELALKVYDRRAIVTEVVSRLHALRSMSGRPLHEQQVSCACQA